ncbi:sigma-70 family RNA polymerase sigma factor [Priestia aryabhattai]|uniref:sigma-70 family RNA polymerase sigma factor n=1 Tax=Priestia TaxID=2800373 RepID=UPI001EB70565|nr:MULTISPECIES: sigma-70 family RNA polymerase sigma factor [Priestia]MBY0092591.1 sigma-70 family RNA polymerase sigma factor [Priestia aryabhattai]MBY0103034.1 sigma-70 family RNA polymerase sigma factor [Priestia aryabhattai]MCY9023621.1 sigma-70 family RNA polymerase sigma factor [Priestia megaterium]
MGKTTLQQEQESKLRRIYRIYRTESKVKKILALEKKWEEYSMLKLDEGEDAFRILYKHSAMKELIRYSVNQFMKDWGRHGFSREDFESIFVQKSWEVTMSHSWSDEYYLFEKLPNAFKQKGLNFIRDNLRTDKRKANYRTVSYVDMSSYRFENEVEIKIMIEQVCSKQEQTLLLTYLEYPSLSYTELGRIHGINHHTKVKRILKSGLEKIKQK